MQFFFSPVLGVLSDRFGRRPVILLSNLGLGRDYIVMALAPTIGWPLTISAGRTGNIRWAILCALSKAAAIQSLGSALAFQLANQTGDRKASGKTDETFGLAKRGDSGLEIVSMKEARVRRPSRHRHRPNPGDAVARTVHKVFRSIFR